MVVAPLYQQQNNLLPRILIHVLRDRQVLLHHVYGDRHLIQLHGSYQLKVHFFGLCATYALCRIPPV